MSGMLASVNSLADALRVQQLGVAIIDLKQPEHGALGALDSNTVKEIVQALPDDAVISATIGDLPMQPALLVTAVQHMADSGVDYIKLGFFPDGDAVACIDALQPLAQQHALIAVLFADQPLDSALVPQLAAAGFAGVMLDTQHKHSGRLLDHLSFDELHDFVTTAKALG
jgi:dihydroneopterin aldolase